MNETQVAMLLALANGHDQRHGTDDVKVAAWYSLLTQEASDMTFDWAQRNVNDHYARSTDMLMPSHIVAAWKNHKSYERSRRAALPVQGVPMPAYVKQAVQELRSRSDRL